MIKHPNCAKFGDLKQFYAWFLVFLGAKMLTSTIFHHFSCKNAYIQFFKIVN